MLPEIVRTLPQSLCKKLDIMAELLCGCAVNDHLSRGKKNRVTKMIFEQHPVQGFLRRTTRVTALAVIPFRSMPGRLFAVLAAILLAILCFAIATGQAAI